LRNMARRLDGVRSNFLPDFWWRMTQLQIA
jgi:hypothetical protein